jgi:2-polyprenyl-3-methyl-5-hydroxy-6-metoxy-1,4-benzoquinol methylase
MKEAKKNTFKTYNIIADWYSQNRSRNLIEKYYVDKLVGLVGNGASVLDVGCGTGVPIMGYLLEMGLNVTGIDASYRMLEMAKLNYPSGNFMQMDMRQLSLNRKFNAIIAWHSFFHLPSEDQPGMFKIFKQHLECNGVLMFTSGKERGEAWEMNGGENMFHASLNTIEYQSLLEEQKFEIILYKEDDAECGNATVWIARLRD